MELFAIYIYAFLLCLVIGPVLSIQGAHLITRKKGLQLLALSQAALLGNIIGHLLFHDNSYAPLFFSFLAFILTKIIFAKYHVSRGDSYVGYYLVLMSLGYLLISIFPMLDSHLTVGLFGDIVSLSNSHAIVLFVIFSFLLILASIFSKKMVANTVETTLLKGRIIDQTEEIYFTITLILSLYGLGFLYTMTFMILPTLVLGENGKSLKQSLIIMSMTSSIASLMGLSWSLVSSRVATVPAQVIVLLGLLFLLKFLLKYRK